MEDIWFMSIGMNWTLFIKMQVTRSDETERNVDVLGLNLGVRNQNVKEPAPSPLR